MAHKSTSDLSKVLESMRETAEFDQQPLTGPNDRGNLGNTPLHVAAVWGDVHAITCLLDNGAAIDAIGEFGETALHVAVQMRKPEAVRALLARGASTGIKNELGKTPLQLAQELGSPLVELFGSN
jgi:ankyrin repeat protein